MRLGEGIRRLTVELHTRKNLSRLNSAHIPPYVLLMAEFQQVTDFSVQ